MSRIKSLCDYISGTQYKLDVFKNNFTEKIVDDMIIFLVCQPNVYTDFYHYSFNCVFHYAKLTGRKKLFILLGDLLDQNIYGNSSYESFEKRFSMYLEAESAERISAVLLLVHQKTVDIELKKKLEEQIIQVFSMKKTYSLGDLKFLLTYSLAGISTPLSSAFKFFNFPESPQNCSL